MARTPTRPRIDDDDDAPENESPQRPALAVVPADEGELPLFPIEECPRARPSAVAYVKLEWIVLDEAGRVEPIRIPGSFAAEIDEAAIAQEFGGGRFRAKACDVKHRTLAAVEFSLPGAPKFTQGAQPRASSSPAVTPPAPVSQVAPGVLATQNLDPVTQMLVSIAQQQAEKAREDSKYQLDMILRTFEAASNKVAAAQPAADPSGVSDALKELRESMREQRKQMQELADENLKLRRQLVGQPREKKEDDDEDLMTFGFKALIEHAAPIVAKDIAPTLSPIAKKLITTAAGEGEGGEG
jgi:hypothetical protein